MHCSHTPVQAYHTGQDTGGTQAYLAVDRKQATLPEQEVAKYTLAVAESNTVQVVHTREQVAAA